MISSGLREHKKRQTRRAIASAALDLALDAGLAGVTTERIVGRAGVSARTFSNYFSCKEEAVVAGHAEELGERFLALLRSRPGNEPPRISVLSALQASLPQAGSSRYDRLLEIMRLFSSNSALSGFCLSHCVRVEREVADLVAGRLGADAARDPYPWVLAGTAVTGCRVALGRWAEDPDATDPHLLLEQVLSLAWGDLARGPERVFPGPFEPLPV